MAGGNNRLRSDHTSIKYNRSPVGKPLSSSEIADFPRDDYTPSISENNDKKSGKRPDSKPPEILTTTELISTVGQIWEYASRPFASFGSYSNSHQSDQGRMNEVTLSNLDDQENEISYSSTTRNKYFCVDLRTASHSPVRAKPTLDFVRVTEKLAVSEPFSENCTRSSFWRLLQTQSGTKSHTEPRRNQGFDSIEISCELEGLYSWMKQTAFSSSKSPNEKVTEAEKKDSDYSVNPRTIKTCCFSSLDEAKSKAKISSVCSDYYLTVNPEPEASISRTSVSDLCNVYHLSSLVNGTSEDSEHNPDDNQPPDSKSEKCDDLVAEDSSNKELKAKPCVSFAKKEHAFAGAFAGIFVSLCLHPVDTVKTVIQSCGSDQKSLFYIGRSIVAERGLTGLYRGIATNMASSAPISAIYTFTYESVKGALLPHLPKEYQSLAHCVAGGVASAATSFVFTPSERIKQQMQIGSHYSNCWNALFGILQTGGFRSLYNGWGAVLCRNVPHSIIKFYTYESLKRLTSSSSSHSTQPNTLQTLVCGGVAGSTAAFFTTPFDVVKTRLQTQVPGAMSQYNSVIHALLEIGRKEGLKGLYCGLTPRLVMYVSQGALFFASYEFFKKILALESYHHETDRIKHEKNKEDSLSFTPLALSQTSATTKLHHSIHSS